MKKAILSITTLLIVLTSNIVWAGVISDNSISKILKLSGLSKQFAEYPGMIKAGMDQAYQQNPSIPADKFADMKRAVEKSFRPEEFLNIIGKEIRSNISEEEAKQLLSWYESNSGRQITLAEENASTPEAYQEMLAESQSLFANKDGIALAKKIDNLVGITEMTVQIQMDTAIAVFTSVSGALNKNQEINIEDFKKHMLSNKKQMTENAEKLTILSCLYSYKNINSNILEKYINFLSKPSTKKFNESVKKGIKVAFKHATIEMAKTLGVIILRTKKQTI